MRYFSTLRHDEIDSLFSVAPTPFGSDSSREVLAHALGATLYTRGTQERLATSILKQSANGATSVVVCLEDAISAARVEEAQASLLDAMGSLVRYPADELPLIFCRVRTPEQIPLIAGADSGELLTGFVLPKFTPDNGTQWLSAVARAAEGRSAPLWAMPVLETWELVDPMKRPQWLHAVKDTLAQHPGLVLNLRVGAADVGGTVGIRRSRELTTYAVAPLRDAISAIIGVFGPDRDLVPAISGCVWEHYPESARWFRPNLRSTVFEDRGAVATRQRIVNAGFDILTEELALDRAHGLVGKTAIHPSQVPLINSWQPVSHEEHADAVAVLANEGATSSDYSNKMNESGPHRAWAQQVTRRAAVAGVLSPRVTWIDVLTAQLAALEGRPRTLLAVAGGSQR